MTTTMTTVAAVMMTPTATPRWTNKLMHTHSHSLVLQISVLLAASGSGHVQGGVFLLRTLSVVPQDCSLDPVGCVQSAVDRAPV